MPARYYLEITVAKELPNEIAKPMTGAEAAAMLRELYRKRAGGGRTMDEIVKEVRELRVEWGD